MRRLALVLVLTACGGLDRRTRCSMRPWRACAVKSRRKLAAVNILSLHRGGRFPRSAQEPAPCSRRLHAGHRASSRQAPLALVPSQRLELGFGGRPYAFDTSATVHLRSSSRRTPDGLVPPFPSRSPPRSLGRSSIRWFEPWSCNPSPRGLPSSLMQHSCFHSTYRSPFRAFVAHSHRRIGRGVRGQGTSSPTPDPACAGRCWPGAARSRRPAGSPRASLSPCRPPSRLRRATTGSA